MYRISPAVLLLSPVCREGEGLGQPMIQMVYYSNNTTLLESRTLFKTRALCLVLSMQLILHEKLVQELSEEVLIPSWEPNFSPSSDLCSYEEGGPG